MNTDNGQLRELETIDALRQNEVPIENQDLTKKQLRDKKVSLKDHRSKAGIVLTKERKDREIGRNEICSCGSGLKYKKCCLK